MTIAIVARYARRSYQIFHKNATLNLLEAKLLFSSNREFQF